MGYGTASSWLPLNAQRRYANLLYHKMEKLPVTPEPSRSSACQQRSPFQKLLLLLYYELTQDVCPWCVRDALANSIGCNPGAKVQGSKL